MGLCEGLVLGLGLREGLGLLDGLFDGLVEGEGLALALADRLGLDDGDGLCCEESGLAPTTATEPLPQGEFIGRAADASAGAIAKPPTRKVPAARQMAARPARMIPTGTVVLRSSSRPDPYPPF